MATFLAGDVAQETGGRGVVEHRRELAVDQHRHVFGCRPERAVHEARRPESPDRLPGEPGVAVCLRIKHRPLPPAVALYSAFAHEHLVLPAIVAGADAVIDKGAPADDLVDVIHALAEGRRLLPAVTALDLLTARTCLDDAELPLLEMLAEGREHADIADALGVSPIAIDHRVDAMLGCLLASTPN